MMERNFNQDLRLIYLKVCEVNSLYGYDKVTIRHILSDNHDAVLYYIHVKQDSLSDELIYVSVPQDYKSVLSFLLGLSYGLF